MTMGGHMQLHVSFLMEMKVIKLLNQFLPISFKVALI